MQNPFSRLERILGPEAMARLSACRVAVFGLGGVGGHAAEALVRSGIGALDLIDHDRISVSNLNRQIFAVHSTMGMLKVDAARARLLDINPELVLRTYPVFYLPENAGDYDLTVYDYIIDAVDTVTAKLTLAENAWHAGVPILSAMGTGNKLDPTAFEIADIYDTSVCHLARIMRKECRKRGIPHLKCLYSREEAIPPTGEEPEDNRRQTPGSSAFVPGTAGLILASEVIKDLTEGIRRNR